MGPTDWITAKLLLSSSKVQTSSIPTFTRVVVFSGFLDRSLNIGWRKERPTSWKVVSIFHYVCLYYCSRATGHSFWPRNLIFCIRVPWNMSKNGFFQILEILIFGRTLVNKRFQGPVVRAIRHMPKESAYAEGRNFRRLEKWSLFFTMYVCTFVRGLQAIVFFKKIGSGTNS